MGDLLYALAQVISVLLLVAGFVLISWYGWLRSWENRRDD
jgi:hypothetical protein